MPLPFQNARISGIYLITSVVLVLASVHFAAAQELLPPARIEAKASRKQPALGLPKRCDGQIDPAVWYESGVWKGADSLRAVPSWMMAQVSEWAEGGALTPVQQLCAKWASEKPKRAVDIVWGPYCGGWFVAVCKKTRSDLGWKSVGFVIPAEGMQPGKGIWDYSHSVNWLEGRICYDLFPRLPSYVQEIIEEMTATELLCPFTEFDPGLNEWPDRPDREIDYDWEADYRER